jgi:hypothetical protein
MSSDLPEPLDALIRSLRERGFAVERDETDTSAFANRLIELRATGGRVVQAVRLSRDRGVWDAAEVEVDGQWAAAYSVLLAIRGAPDQQRAESHEERRQTTLAVVDWDGAVDLDAIKRRLDEQRRAHQLRFQKPSD